MLVFFLKFFFKCKIQICFTIIEKIEQNLGAFYLSLINQNHFSIGAQSNISIPELILTVIMATHYFFDIERLEVDPDSNLKLLNQIELEKFLILF